MGLIRVLHEKVASQIAAGEVIERPVSVVRELIDNSIDAGSSRIFILIERGGKKLIRVSDNGSGMDRDDLLLSIERHATSKISSVSDLFSIRSLGFRGEALPSIGAASRMEITSRPNDRLSGHRLKVAGDRVISIEEIGCPVGTVVEVRDLFYNLPARRKFLRGDKTETDQILDLVARVGLPRLQIHFRLDEGDHTLINLAPCSEQAGRLPALFGRDAADTMKQASFRAQDFRIEAYLGSPDFARSKSDRILFYVNGRSVRDRLLMHGIMEGYGQRLLRGSYPPAAVFLDVDPSLVDVNVHPAKQEIRIQNGREIHQALIQVVQEGLGTKVHPVPDGDSGVLGPPEERTPSFQMVLEHSAEYAPEEEGKGRAPRQEPDFRILGQLRETYILFETAEGLILMDQHAAHERILYEALKRSYENSRLETQSFLIPPRLEFSLQDTRMITERLDSLRDLGLEIEPFGGTTFLLRSIPSLLARARWEKLFSELIPVLNDRERMEKSSVSDASLTLLACHGAIRAGQRLSEQEMVHLAKELFETSLPTNCPHGRPTMRRFSFGELEKSFKRIV